MLLWPGWLAGAVNPPQADRDFVPTCALPPPPPKPTLPTPQAEHGCRATGTGAPSSRWWPLWTRLPRMPWPRSSSWTRPPLQTPRPRCACFCIRKVCPTATKLATALGRAQEGAGRAAGQALGVVRFFGKEREADRNVHSAAHTRPLRHATLQAANQLLAPAPAAGDCCPPARDPQDGHPPGSGGHSGHQAVPAV